MWKARPPAFTIQPDVVCWYFFSLCFAFAKETHLKPSTVGWLAYSRRTCIALLSAQTGRADENDTVHTGNGRLTELSCLFSCPVKAPSCPMAERRCHKSRIVHDVTRNKTKIVCVSWLFVFCFFLSIFLSLFVWVSLLRVSFGRVICCLFFFKVSHLSMNYFSCVSCILISHQSTKSPPIKKRLFSLNLI